MGNSKLKKPDWHSRRHETSDAQKKAYIAHQTRASRRPKQRWNPETKKWEKEDK